MITDRMINITMTKDKAMTVISTNRTIPVLWTTDHIKATITPDEITTDMIYRTT